MKTIALIILAAIYCLPVFSQDTLFTKNGEVIPAKVFEINQTEIKYKKPSNPDGPLYTMNKSEVAVIEYKNGTKDVFSSDVASNSRNSTQNGNTPTVNNNYYPNNNPNYSPRPRVNVIIGTPPVVIGSPWGYGGYGYGYAYRPFRHHHRRCW